MIPREMSKEFQRVLRELGNRRFGTIFCSSAESWFLEGKSFFGAKSFDNFAVKWFIAESITLREKMIHGHEKGLL